MLVEVGAFVFMVECGGGSGGGGTSVRWRLRSRDRASIRLVSAGSAILPD